MDSVACCNIYVCARQLQCLDWLNIAKASKHNIAWSSSKSKNKDHNFQCLNDSSNDVQRSWAFLVKRLVIKRCMLFVLDEFIKSWKTTVTVFPLQLLYLKSTTVKRICKCNNTIDIKYFKLTKDIRLL